jgi:hypothetical protein
LERFQLTPDEVAQIPSRKVKTPQPKLEKRRRQFVRVPMEWFEKLGGAPGQTFFIAVYVLYMDWKSLGKPFPLANGMLKFDGVGRHAKYKALRELERRGLVTVEWRRRRSPIVRRIV